MRLTVSLPVVTPSLNTLLRSHWHKRKQLKQGFKWELLVAGACEPRYKINGAKKRRIEVKAFRSRLLDHDNFIGGLKPLLDGLIELELLHDDGPEFLELKAEQLKASKTDQKLEIIIEDLT
jgi:hypothetical protein